ncbi:MAG: stress-induced protein [Candidatus Magasanikbacteria bacterium]
MKKEKKQGFLSMTVKQRQAIARKGGQSAHATGKAHKLTFEERSKGGQKSQGNFKYRPEAAKEAGRKGGKARKRRKILSENSPSPVGLVG